MAAHVSECRMLDRVLESICSMTVEEEELQYNIFLKKYADPVLAHMLTAHAAACFVGKIEINFDDATGKATVDVANSSLFKVADRKSSTDWRTCVQNRQPLWGRIKIIFESGSHANAFLITFPQKGDDPSKITVEFFEPHGEATWSDAVFKASLAELTRQIPDIMANVDLVLPLDFCPNYSVQAVADDARCYNWSSLYMVLRLMCPAVGRAQLIKQLTGMGKDGLGDLMAKWSCFQWSYGRANGVMEQVDSNRSWNELLDQERLDLIRLKGEVGSWGSSIWDLSKEISSAISNPSLSEAEAKVLLNKLAKEKQMLLKIKQLLAVDTSAWDLRVRSEFNTAVREGQIELAQTLVQKTEILDEISKLNFQEFRWRVSAALTTSSGDEDHPDAVPFVREFLEKVDVLRDAIAAKSGSEIAPEILKEWKNWVDQPEALDAFFQNEREDALNDVKNSLLRISSLFEYERAKSTIRAGKLDEKKRKAWKVWEDKLKAVETEEDLKEVLALIQAKSEYQHCDAARSAGKPCLIERKTPLLQEVERGEIKLRELWSGARYLPKRVKEFLEETRESINRSIQRNVELPDADYSLDFIDLASPFLRFEKEFAKVDQELIRKSESWVEEGKFPNMVKVWSEWVNAETDLRVLFDLFEEAPLEKELEFQKQKLASDLPFFAAYTKLQRRVFEEESALEGRILEERIAFEKRIADERSALERKIADERSALERKIMAPLYNARPEELEALTDPERAAAKTASAGPARVASEADLSASRLGELALRSNDTAVEQSLSQLVEEGLSLRKLGRTDQKAKARTDVTYEQRTENLVVAILDRVQTELLKKGVTAADMKRQLNSFFNKNLLFILHTDQCAGRFTSSSDDLERLKKIPSFLRDAVRELVAHVGHRKELCDLGFNAAKAWLARHE